MSKVSFEILHMNDVVLSPTNPRKTIENGELKELAASIKEQGVIQPIVVRIKNKKYEVVCGERRYKASQLLECVTIPAIIRDLNDKQAFEFQITENLQRKDVHPIQEADAIKKLFDNKYSMEEVCKVLGKNAEYISARYKLSTLVPEFRKAFLNDEINLGQALIMAKLEPQYQKQLAAEDDKYWLDSIDDTRAHVEKNLMPQLANAKFDTKATDVKPGACTTCPKNTACNLTLFPEQKDTPRCTDRACFANKEKLFFDINLEKYKKDPSVTFISSNHSNQDRVNKLKKEGQEVVDQYSINRIDMPELPDPDDYSWCETKKERDEEMESDMQKYRKDMEAYEKKIKRAQKGFIVNGQDAGQVIYFQPEKHSKKDVESGAADKSVKEQIAGIQERAKRSLELDYQKVLEGVHEAFEDHPMLSNKSKPMSELEEAIMWFIILEKLGSYDGYEEITGFEIDHNDDWESVIKKLKQLSDGKKAQIIRNAFTDNFNDKLVTGNPTVEQRLKYLLLKEWSPKVVEELQKEQDEVAAKRIERSNARIKQLQGSTKKPVKKGLAAILPEDKKKPAAGKKKVKK